MCKNLSRSGFDARVTPTRIKQGRVNIHEKRGSLKQEEIVQKSAGKKPGTFLHRKVMPIILPRHGLEQGPCLRIPDKS